MAISQAMAATMTNFVEVVTERYLFGTEDLMASRRFLGEQWRMRWSTNISEFSNADAKRRANVASIHSNDAAVPSLAMAVWFS